MQLLEIASYGHAQYFNSNGSFALPVVTPTMSVMISSTKIVMIRSLDPIIDMVAYILLMIKPYVERHWPLTVKSLKRQCSGREAM